MIDLESSTKKIEEQCYNCGCNLKKVCPGYKDQPDDELVNGKNITIDEHTWHTIQLGKYKSDIIRDLDKAVKCASSNDFGTSFKTALASICYANDRKLVEEYKLSLLGTKNE